MNWTQPWALIFPVLLLAVLLKRSRITRSAVTYSFLDNFKDIGSSWRLALRQFLIATSCLGTVLFLSIAVLRPQTVTMISQPREARNLMLAIDLSGSMRTRDFSYRQQAIDRLSAVKIVVAEFIEQRKADRIGLVVFGTQAFLQTPLTSDSKMLLEMLKQLELGLAGDGTAIGDGLGLALRRLDAVEGDSKAVVLLTDGVNTAGSVDPAQAAKVAKELKIKVHTVGIGAQDTARRAGSSIFGRNNTKQYEFDEKTLKSIAQITDGVYFNAENLQELQEVYQEIDKLEKSVDELPDLPLPEEHFMSFVQYALALYLIYLLTNNILLARIPW